MKAGIGIADITPPQGSELAGYYYERRVSGVHDPLHAKTLLFDDGSTRAAIIAFDLCSISDEAVEEIHSRIADMGIVQPENVILCATHTHTGPTPDAFNSYLPEKACESLQQAAVSLRQVSVSCGTADMKGLGFNRRYIMTDGSTVTNPGKCNPDITGPAGPAPERAYFVSFDFGGECAVLVNVPLHPDTVGGDIVSADYPFSIVQTMQAKADEVAFVIFTDGTSGDINHWDVKDPSPQRGFEEAARIGVRIGAAVADELEAARPIAGGTLRTGHAFAKLPCLRPSAEDIARAEETIKKPVPQGVDFTLEAVEAKKILRAAALEKPYITLRLTAITLGDLAFVGMPAELFIELGDEIKKRSPFKDTVIICVADAKVGYIPTPKAYRQGGYEVVSNILESTAGTVMVEKTLELLESLR